MSAYEFDADSVYKAQDKLFKALVHMEAVVERPLRRISYPEMPAAVLGQVQGGVAEVISTISTARASIADVARNMKQKTYDLVDHKDPNSLGWGWKVGDFVFVDATAFTGTDILYKATNYDQFGWKGVAGSAVAFGTNFIPVGKIFKVVGKGGKIALGVARGARYGRAAEVAAQLERAAAAEGMHVRLPGGVPGGSSAVDDAVKGAGHAHPTRGTLHPTSSSGGVADMSEAVASRPGLPTPINASHLYSQASTEGKLLAQATGGTIIDNSSVAQHLAALDLYKVLPPALADKIWARASVNFVDRSSGRLTAVLQAQVNGTRVFAKYEVPAILANARITSLEIVRARGVDLQPYRYVTIDRTSPTAAADMLRQINLGGRILFTFRP